MFGKDIVPETWAKMLFANQIVVLLNERNLQIKSMK